MRIASTLSRLWRSSARRAEARRRAKAGDKQTIDANDDPDLPVAHFHGDTHRPANVRKFEDVLRHAPRDPKPRH